mmetsp:Transcript_14550/g.33685  ORF Transcript_14550/g.33685 Transcript_14550/m.33685 type:complete len:110 (+) Transcript_14550:614-943(+)
MPRHQHGRFEAVLFDYGGNRTRSDSSTTKRRIDDSRILEGNGMSRNGCARTPKMCQACCIVDWLSPIMATNHSEIEAASTETEETGPFCHENAQPVRNNYVMGMLAPNQ